ncbi:hypothetical protein GIB67_033313, partial [Kingdonia uniflora]
GVNKLADLVGDTLRPKGRIGVLESKYGSPKIVNDGVTVAKEVELEDPVENIGTKLVRQATANTNDLVGDGTTTSVVLAQGLIAEDVKARGFGREDWLQALPRALVARFVKIDKEFQSRGETSGTTVTFVIIDGWTVTVASVGDSRCNLDSRGGGLSILIVDHRLEENVERERVTSSGDEVRRLNIVSGVGSIILYSDWPSSLLAWMSVPFKVKWRHGCRGIHSSYTICQTSEAKSPNLEYFSIGKLVIKCRGRLIIASDGIWDAISAEMATKSCRGLPARPQSLHLSKLLRKRSYDPASKLAKKLSVVGIVEELFEKGSAMLAD